MSTLEGISARQATESAPLCECASPVDAPDSLPRELLARDSFARRRQELALLLALWLVHGAGNFWWLWKDTRPPFSDMAGHAITTLRMSTWPWRQWVMDGSIFDALLRVDPYPPFFYVTTLPFVWFVSPAMDALLVVNWLYLGLLIFSTYGIGRLAAGGRVGLLAALLVSLYPILYGLSRHYLADVALTAVTTFALFCIFWSEAFQRRWPSLLLGVAIGVGVLTKWTFIVFLIGPLAVAAIMTVRHATRARLANLAFAAAISLLIGLPWYLTNLGKLQEFLLFNSTLAGPQEGEAPVWSLESWVYYLRELLVRQMLLPFVLLFGVGFVAVLRRCRLNGYLWMLLLWIGVAYIASTLFINKDTRYTMPYLPAFALLTAIGLMQLRRTMLWRVVLALTIAWSLLQYVGLTAGLYWRPTEVPIAMGWTIEPLSVPVSVVVYSEMVHVATPARHEDWQIEAILAAALADAGPRSPESPITLLVVSEQPPFDAQAFSYVRRRDKLPVEVTLVTGIAEKDSAAELQRSDYIVVKEGDLGKEFALQDARELADLLLDPASPLAAQVEAIGDFALPDGSTAHLFRHARDE